MLSSTSARGPQVSPGRFPELEAAWSRPGQQLRTQAQPGLPGPGPATRGPAAGWEDVGGAPIPEREASEGGGKKGGAAGDEEEEGKKERERGKEGGRRRCTRAEEEGGREGERSPARKLGECGIGAEGREPETLRLLGAEYLASLMGFPSAPSRACSAPVLGPCPGSLQPFRGPQELLLASPLLQGPMVSKATWRGVPGRGGRGTSLGGNSGGAQPLTTAKGGLFFLQRWC